MSCSVLAKLGDVPVTTGQPAVTSNPVTIVSTRLGLLPPPTTLLPLPSTGDVKPNPKSPVVKPREPEPTPSVMPTRAPTSTINLYGALLRTRKATGVGALRVLWPTVMVPKGPMAASRTPLLVALIVNAGRTAPPNVP